MNGNIEKIAENNGFEVNDIVNIPEINATLYQMKYSKNNAQLIWLKRDDENKTFAIAFKTIPENDRGVFHILEHSVLCGSKKYPIKEPFVELVKSSMQTFLNAFTFPDKTMYPFSTRNDKDFLNLMDVYMDAVFHPLSLEHKEPFLQEGWHYEMTNKDANLICNGVVYNEMKGALASTDTILMSETNRILFPGNSYRFESGGSPEHIPELTYEEYIQAHDKYYHPSNARIILDGNIKIEEVLEKIDGFLTEYNQLEPDFDLEIQKPIVQEESVRYYSIGENENPDNRVILSESFVYGKYDEPEKNIGCTILGEILCTTAKDPLKKVILKNGLAENIEITQTDGILQPYVSIVVRNTSETNKEKIWEMVHKTLEKTAKEGLDKKRLKSIINKMDFRMREKDYGNMPMGIVYALNIMDSWLYGGNPTQNLCYNKIFESLRKKVDEGYFEELLRQIFLENNHHGKVCLMPSKTLSKEQAEEERKRLECIKSKWTDEDKNRIIEEVSRLKEYQMTKDTKTDLAKLPMLDLKDIPEEISFVEQKVIHLNENVLLNQKIDTNGILYAKIYISLKDQSVENLRMISLMSMLLGHMSTGNYSEAELNTLLGDKLGHFKVQTKIVYEPGNVKDCTPYLTVGIATLQDRKDEVFDLIKEILLNSNFDETEYIKNKIKQICTFYGQQIIMSGDKYASMHIASAFSAQGYVCEEIFGLNMFRWLRKVDECFDEMEVAKQFYELCSNLFVRDRITLSVTGDCDKKWCTKMINSFPKAKKAPGKPVEYTVNKISANGLEIAAEISFAAKTANLYAGGYKYTGAMKTAAHILSYDYLWKEVRVKGGAYGCALTILDNGNISYTTYRDPNPMNSLECFKNAGDALLKICETEESINKYIISTIAKTNPLMPARAKGENEAENYLCGVTREQRQLLQREILNTTKEDLKEISRILNEVENQSINYVVGSKNVLERCKEHLGKIETL